MTQQADQPQITVSEGQVQGYRVVYEHGPTSWGAYAPELPGLGAAAESREEVEQLIREAIPLYLETLEEDRQQRPWLYSEPESDMPNRG